MISDPSMMIHIDPKCPDSNQTPPSLLRLLKKKGASFSTTSIAAPAMMPVFKPSEIEHIEMTKPKLNKGRNFPCRKWRHIMSYSCNFLTSFGTCSNLFCKTSSSTSSSRRPPESPESRRWVHHGRCWQSSCALRVHGIPAFREAISNISRQRIHKNIMEYHMDVDLRFDLDPLRFSKHMQTFSSILSLDSLAWSC